MQVTLSPEKTRAARTLSDGRPTRVALVGTGFIAYLHLEALREVASVEVVALCDVALARAEATGAMRSRWSEKMSANIAFSARQVARRSSSFSSRRMTSASVE